MPERLTEAGDDPTKVTARQVRIAIILTLFVLLLRLGVQVATGEAAHGDFSALYAGAYMVAHGEGARLYNLEQEKSTEEALLKRPGLLPFLHPPFEALLLAPLARLSYTRAYLWWGAFNILLWVLFVRAIRPAAVVPQQPFRYLILCFAFPPLWTALLEGQTSIIVLLLCGLSYLRLRGGRAFEAGVWLGVALLRFQVAAPLAVVCLLDRRWRMMAGFALMAGVLAAVSLGVVGSSGVVSYAELVLDTVRHPERPAYLSNSVRQMPSLRGLLGAFPSMGGAWVGALLAVVLVLLMVGAAWLWRRREQYDSDPGLPMAAAAMVALLGFQVHVHDLSLVLLAVLLVAASPEWTAHRGWRRLFMASAAILYLPPLYTVADTRELTYLLCFPVVGLAAATLGLLGRRSGRVPDKASGAGC